MDQATNFREEDPNVLTPEELAILKRHEARRKGVQDRYSQGGMASPFAFARTNLRAMRMGAGNPGQSFAAPEEQGASPDGFNAAGAEFTDPSVREGRRPGIPGDLLNEAYQMGTGVLGDMMAEGANQVVYDIPGVARDVLANSYIMPTGVEPPKMGWSNPVGEERQPSVTNALAGPATMVFDPLGGPLTAGGLWLAGKGIKGIVNMAKSKTAQGLMDVVGRIGVRTMPMMMSAGPNRFTSEPAADILKEAFMRYMKEPSMEAAAAVRKASMRLNSELDRAAASTGVPQRGPLGAMRAGDLLQMWRRQARGNPQALKSLDDLEQVLNYEIEPPNVNPQWGPTEGWDAPATPLRKEPPKPLPRNVKPVKPTVIQPEEKKLVPPTEVIEPERVPPKVIQPPKPVPATPVEAVSNRITDQVAAKYRGSQVGGMMSGLDRAVREADAASAALRSTPTDKAALDSVLERMSVLDSQIDAVTTRLSKLKDPMEQKDAKSALEFAMGERDKLRRWIKEDVIKNQPGVIQQGGGVSGGTVYRSGLEEKTLDDIFNEMVIRSRTEDPDRVMINLWEKYGLDDDAILYMSERAQKLSRTGN